MPRSASIYFVDSDLASRRRLTEHLGRRGFEIWPFDSAERLLVVLDMLPPSCILLNIGPDRGRDIELVKSLSERSGGWPIIVLDAEPDVATAVAAMHAGAADFLENSDDHAPLEHALGTAMASLDRMLAADCSRQDAQTRLARLTPREKEVATSLIGGLIRAWSAELSILAGIVIIIMGLHFLGLTRIGLLMREGRLTAPKPVGLWGAYVMGLAFAFGWTPCIGPILAAILSIAAAEATVTKGAGLLAVYSAGLGIPFLIAALMIEQFSKLFARMKGQLVNVERAMGVLMVITGIGFLTGTVSNVSIWLLETFPALQTIG